jgi:hypothetical protein
VLARELPAVDRGPFRTELFEAMVAQIDAGGIDRDIDLRPYWRTGAFLYRYARTTPVTYAGYYPAVSVPIGPDRELANCPREHVGALQRRLKKMGGELNVLVIGYSGLDDEVMELLAAGGSGHRLGNAATAARPTPGARP